jgi:lipid A ethanolaminephosphotransferase
MLKKTLSNRHTSNEARNIRTNTLFSLNNKPELITLTSFLPLVIALFLTLAANTPLWSELFKIKGGLSFETIAYYSPFFLILTLTYTLFFSLIRFKYLFKIMTIFILLTASIAAYFMNSYGVMIDKSMIQNALETDIAETSELFSIQMLFYLVFLGILPSIIILRLPLNYKPFLKQLLSNLLVAIISLIIIVTTVFYFFGDFAPLYRNNRYVRHLINPVNYIKSIGSNISRLSGNQNKPIQAIGLDASLPPQSVKNNKNTLTILVVGETARAKNFSLNGYPRETNPYLKQEEIIYYNNFYSCGTATATSVPCMFSLLTHQTYSDSDAKYTEGLLDVLKHAGVDVLWRDNNSGCKGACARVLYENMANLKDKTFCNTEECFDEILLNNLQNYIDEREKDTLIVLHQKGSHGPSYHLRVPQQFKTFTPICENSQVNECTKESLINAYDNTIIYTDYFLKQVIKVLKQNSAKYNTAMIYVSDHGESLGENNMYLHGLPYMMAPDEQIHVPFILWFSDQLKSSLGINSECLEQKSTSKYSHDNLFHSVLGLMNVNTSIYDTELDLFAPCRNSIG